MIRHIFMLAVMILLAAILLYLSRFWIFSWWGRDGLFGIEALRPQGDLVSRWLRGTDFRPFELVLWVIGGFLILTWVQKLVDWLTPADTQAEEHEE